MKGLTPNPSPKGEGSRMNLQLGVANQGFKGFGALRLKLYLELSFRILNKIFSFNFKLHFEPQATHYKSEKRKEKSEK